MCGSKSIGWRRIATARSTYGFVAAATAARSAAAVRVACTAAVAGRIAARGRVAPRPCGRQRERAGLGAVGASSRGAALAIRRGPVAGAGGGAARPGAAGAVGGAIIATRGAELHACPAVMNSARCSRDTRPALGDAHVDLRAAYATVKWCRVLDVGIARAHDEAAPGIVLDLEPTLPRSSSRDPRPVRATRYDVAALPRASRRRGFERAAVHGDRLRYRLAAIGAACATAELQAASAAPAANAPAAPSPNPRARRARPHAASRSAAPATIGARCS